MDPHRCPDFKHNSQFMTMSEDFDIFAFVEQMSNAQLLPDSEVSPVWFDLLIFSQLFSRRHQSIVVSTTMTNFGSMVLLFSTTRSIISIPCSCPVLRIPPS